MSGPGGDASDLRLTTTADEAAFWLLQRDKGRALEADPGFASWLGSSEGHARAWARAVAIWDDCGDGSDPLLEAMRRDALMARPPMQPALRWGMTAASLAAVMLVTALGWRVINPLSGTRAPGQAIPANAAPSLVAGAGGPSTFVLADGSRVTLAANAALAVAYGGQRRAVRLLRGDAFFSVAHDAARAFTADIGDRTLSDLGTEFDAHLDGRTLSVTLIKGSVAVRSPGGASPAILTPGERLDASPGQADQISAVDVDSVPSWRIRDLEFHDQPLDAAISAVNRYGGAPARIVDPSVRGLRVSGQFRTGDPTRFAATLSDIYPLRLTHRADGGVDIAGR